MTEPGRFEARLAASLARLADGVPTEVDPVRLTSTVASVERRAWPSTWTAPRSLRLAPALQVAIVLAALVGLALALMVLAPRLMQEPFEAQLRGLIVCEGVPWTTSDVGAVELTCRSELPDPRMAGPVRITLGHRVSAAGDRSGALVIEGRGATWTGELLVKAVPNGLAMGDAVLIGDGAGDRVVLSLHLLSADGLAWGILATTSAEETR